AGEHSLQKQENDRERAKLETSKTKYGVTFDAWEWRCFVSDWKICRPVRKSNPCRRRGKRSDLMQFNGT
ncbi:MAG TPA: hypothetical protein VGO47_13110, partial [Chlamydiales bacterium]|nr:hypothetical protein [Chlamydiales bacterium]